MYRSVIPLSASELVMSGSSFSSLDNFSIIESTTAVIDSLFSTIKFFFTFLACLCRAAIFRPMLIPSWMGDMVRLIQTRFDSVSPELFFLLYLFDRKPCARILRHLWVCEFVCIFLRGSPQFFDSNFQARSNKENILCLLLQASSHSLAHSQLQFGG